MPSVSILEFTSYTQSVAPLEKNARSLEAFARACGRRRLPSFARLTLAGMLAQALHNGFVRLRSLALGSDDESSVGTALVPHVGCCEL
jgi:hypothetical protein